MRKKISMSICIIAVMFTFLPLFGKSLSATDVIQEGSKCYFFWR